jgi:hypothetical protein
MFGRDKRHQKEEYKGFITMEDSEEIQEVFEKKKLPAILGGEQFISRIRERFFEGKDHKEVPEWGDLAPERQQIKQAVCRVYQLDEDELLKWRRGVFNEPRNVVIYVIRLLRNDGLEETGREFHMSRYSSVSSAI